MHLPPKPEKPLPPDDIIPRKQEISPDQIAEALKEVKYGRVTLFLQDGKIYQMEQMKITKPT